MRQRNLLNSGIIVLACTASLAQAQQNGGFETLDGGWATGWTKTGTVEIQTANPGTASVNHYALFKEAGSGGLSRIYQTITIPSSTVQPKLQFMYQAVYDQPSRSSPVPPDSFTAFLFTEPAGASSEYRLSVTDPSYIKGFLYADSDGKLLHGPHVVVSADSSGLTIVQVELSSLADTSLRLEFGFANAANGVNSFVVLDSIVMFTTEDPLCNPDQTPPLITCPDDIISPSSNPDDSGRPTISDNCPNIGTPSYQDDVDCGCPTVVYRNWTVQDAAHFTASCGPQKITDLNPETDFYDCLEELFGDCFRRPNLKCQCSPLPLACTDPDGLPLSTHVNGGCTIAEMLTACFKEGIRNGGGIQTCAVHLAQTLKDAHLICETGPDQGKISSCVADIHQELLDAINNHTYNYTTCRGGPIGTEPCTQDTDCNSAPSGNCCEADNGKYCVYGDQPCPMPPPPASCSNF